MHTPGTGSHRPGLRKETMIEDPKQVARSILGIHPDAVVTIITEDIQALVQWAKDNAGKKLQEAWSEIWLKHEGRWGTTKAWPMLHFELGGYAKDGATEYYRVFTLEQFMARHRVTLELLQFLADGTYDQDLLNEASGIGLALQNTMMLFDGAMLSTKLPPTLRNHYATTFLGKGTKLGWLE